MSVYGLLVNNSIGDVLIDPDAFTMKQVAAAVFYGGGYTGPVSVSMPGVLPGMIVIIVPLYGSTAGSNIQNNTFEYRNVFAAIPYGVAGNGVVTLYKASGANLRTILNVGIYVLTQN